MVAESWTVASNTKSNNEESGPVYLNIAETNNSLSLSSCSRRDRTDISGKDV